MYDIIISIFFSGLLCTLNVFLCFSNLFGVDLLKAYTLCTLQVQLHSASVVTSELSNRWEAPLFKE